MCLSVCVCVCLSARIGKRERLKKREREKERERERARKRERERQFASTPFPVQSNTSARNTAFDADDKGLKKFSFGSFPKLKQNKQ